MAIDYYPIHCHRLACTRVNKINPRTSPPPMLHFLSVIIKKGIKYQKYGGSLPWRSSHLMWKKRFSVVATGHPQTPDTHLFGTFSTPPGNSEDNWRIFWKELSAYFMPFYFEKFHLKVELAGSRDESSDHRHSDSSLAFLEAPTALGEALTLHTEDRLSLQCHLIYHPGE